MSLVSFLSRFPDDDACWAHLEAMRWPAGPVCPRCGSVGEATAQKSRVHYWQCRACRALFAVAMGTALEGTHLPMRTWFTALYLVAASSEGISSVKLGEHLDIGQKTAWFLGQRIRRMMDGRDGLLRGIVEMDETYLVGKKRAKGQPSTRDHDDDQPTGRSGSCKSMVGVATERGGRARTAKGRTQARCVGVNHRKVRDRRKDLLHQISHRLTAKADVLKVETLNVRGMARNRHFALSVADAGVSRLVAFCRYKADWRGRRIEKLDPWFPGSQTCCMRGARHREIKTSRCG
jgi:IS605 OrfB family transposase